MNEYQIEDKYYKFLSELYSAQIAFDIDNDILKSMGIPPLETNDKIQSIKKKIEDFRLENAEYFI